MLEGAVGVNRHDFSNERPAYSVHPPALIRHLLFRLSPGINPRFTADEAERQHRWAELCRRLSDHLTAVCREFREDMSEVVILPPGDEADEEKFRFSVRRTALVIVGAEERGYQFRLRLDVYTELFSITYLVDEIGDRAPATLRAEMARLPHDPSNLDWLFDRFWTSDDFTPGRLTDDWIAGRDASAGQGRPLGDLIADFRSIVLPPRRDWPMDDPSLELRSIGTRQDDTLCPEILAFASQNHALLRAVAGSDGSTVPRGTESVVCGMSGGLALYASALGQWAQDARKTKPLRHLLVYAGHSHAQLGRLIRRMHILGELRHAAVMDWDLGPKGNDLNSASLKLRNLGKDVDEAMSSQPDIAKIGAILSDLATIGTVGQGGLTYRVEQSRYYAQEFLNQLEHLRIVRVPGWQPYDDFVKRHIMQLFGRIDRIGNRYEALGRRVDRLMFYEQAAGFEGYHSRVSGALQELRDVIGRLHRTNEHQKKLLENAEYFAIVFLIYYFGSICAEAAKADPTIFAFTGLTAGTAYRIWVGAAAFVAIPVLVVLVSLKLWRLVAYIGQRVRRLTSTGSKE